MKRSTHSLRPDRILSTSPSTIPPRSLSSTTTSPSITTNLGTSSSSFALNQSSSDSSQPLLDHHQHFGVGDRVKCSNSMVGLCRFIGTIDHKHGIWVGIDLGAQVEDEGQERWYGKGKNSGSVNGKSYFECQPDCGIFFPIAKVSAFPYSAPSLPFPRSDSPSKPLQLINSPRSTRISRPTLPPPNPTPRPKPRPSLPAPPITTSRKPTLTPSVSATTIARPLVRKLSSNLPLDRSASKINSPPPLPRSAHPLASSIASHLKRSSASQLPNRAPSRGSHKRAESVQSHYRSPSDWTRPTTTAQTPRRPKSRLSQISTDSRIVRDDLPINAPDADELERLAMRLKIEELEKVATEHIDYEAELARARQTARNLEDELAHLKAEAQRPCAEAPRLASAERELVEHAALAEAARSKAEQAAQLAETERAREEQAVRLAEAERAREEQAVRLGQAERARAELEKQQTELKEQLGQLRSAGQSLCSVYEEKIADLVEQREEEAETAGRLQAELDAIRQVLSAVRSGPSGGASRIASRPQEAVEIDNERLRADLKYTKERLGELQDQAYELRQELASEREGREELSQRYDEARQEHKQIVKRLKEEAAAEAKEREACQARLAQVETRFKEALETMEQERAELEGLRNEVLVSAHPLGEHFTPTVGRTSPRDLDQQDTNRLRVELGQRGSPTPSSTTMVDQERQLVVQKYERLLKTKEDESLELLSRIQELEDQLSQSSSISSTTTTTTNGGDGGGRGKLKPIRTCSSRFEGEPPAMIGDCECEHRRDGFLSPIRNNSTGPTAGELLSYSNGIHFDHQSLAKAEQEILGLKVIVNQSNIERTEMVEVNRRLRLEVDELKQTNRELEHRVDLILNKSNCNHKSPRRPSGQGMMTPERTPTTGGFESLATDEELNEVNGGEERKVNRLEREVEVLRRQVTEMERKHMREVRALNKEVAELESMIESKVFKEEELEAELEDLKRRAPRPASGGRVLSHQDQSGIETDRDRDEGSYSYDDDGAGSEGQMMDVLSIPVEPNGKNATGGGDQDRAPATGIAIEVRRGSSVRSRSRRGLERDSLNESKRDQDLCELCEGSDHTVEGCPIFVLGVC